MAPRQFFLLRLNFLPNEYRFWWPQQVISLEREEQELEQCGLFCLSNKLSIRCSLSLSRSRVLLCILSKPPWINFAKNILISLLLKCFPGSFTAFFSFLSFFLLLFRFYVSTIKFSLNMMSHHKHWNFVCFTNSPFGWFSGKSCIVYILFVFAIISLSFTTRFWYVCHRHKPLDLMAIACVSLDGLYFDMHY